jgi:hypothetical protein
MIRIGTIAMMVEAIPADVCCTAKRENETPRKGPKKDPVVIAAITLLFRKAATTEFHLPESKMISRNPVIPVIMRICVEAKGL